MTIYAGLIVIYLNVFAFLYYETPHLASLNPLNNSHI